jgi:DNA-binding NarL/FixJ family response regulator/signal transduction histidine kinase
MFQVVIAEEQSITRHAARIALEQDGHRVIGEAADGLETVRVVQRLKPDLLLLGLDMRRLNGLEVIRRLHRSLPALKILVLTTHDSAHTVALCARSGASGFVSKADDIGGLRLALKALGRGQTYFPAFDLGVLSTDATARTEEEQLKSLSPRELSVLTYLANGYRVGQIAQEMLISDRTVSTYKVRLLEKLNAGSLVELAEIAHRHILGGAAGHVEVPAKPEWWNDEYDRTCLLLDAIPAALAVRDVPGRVLFANKYLRELLGDRVENFLASSTPLDQALEAGIYEQHAREVQAAFEDAATRGVPYRCEVMGKRNGNLVTGLHWGAPVRNRNNEIKAMVCGTQAINEQEQTILEQRDARARADAANHATTALLLTYGHELSEPLSRANAMLDELLADEAVPQSASNGLVKVRATLRGIEERVQHLHLLASAGEADSKEVPEPCDLRQLITNIAESLQQLAETSQTTFAIEVDGGDIMACWLDTHRFKPLVTLLLRHACAAATGPHVRVRLHTTIRTRGLLDVTIHIEPDCAPASIDAAAKTGGDIAQAELQLSRRLANLLNASLVVSDAHHPLQIELKLTLPRVMQR